MEQSVSYISKTQVDYLITRYSRENGVQLSSNKHIPSSVSNVIKSYYPKMNGHEFIWKIKNANLLKEIIRPSSTPQTFDSDVFDVGLSNKFFLQLEPYSQSTHRSGNRAQSTDYERGTAYGRGGYRGGRGYHSNQERDSADPRYQNYIEMKDQKNTNIMLNLMAFPLPSKYKFIIFHCELYFNEINAEYSTIWNIKNKKRNDGNDYNRYDPQPAIDDNTYTKFGWVINYDLKRYNFDEMTFYCKINVLQIVKNEVPMQRMNNRYHGGYRPYSYDDENNKKPDIYSYESVYNSKTKKNMKFIWNITSKHILDRLMGHTDYKGIIQYHSDVFYDIFQLKLSRENDTNYFVISICGLPRNTHLMGVKIELFAMKNDTMISYASKSNDNNIKIISSIISFSYAEPTYILPKNKNEILINLLMTYKKLSLFCIANIIQKYDANDNNVNDMEIGPIFDIDKVSYNIESKSEEETINMREIRKQIILSKQKIIELSHDTFIWHIMEKYDNDLLNTIKESISKKQRATFNSDIFKLFGRKWYISISMESDNDYRSRRPHSINDKNNQISISLNCLTNSRESVDCKVSILLIQTNNKMSFYECFDFNTRRGYGPYGDRRHALLQNALAIMELNEMTLKIDISIVNDDIVYPPEPVGYFPSYGRERVQNIDIDNDNDNKYDGDTLVKEEVKKWLIETVELPNYLKLFQKHSIEDLNIVKLLTMDSLKMMGVARIGHQLKILHQIDILKQLKK